MKKITYCLIVFAFIFNYLNAQVKDTISIGAGYTQQVWYKLDTDKETKARNNDWDLAFSTRAQRDAAIWVNPNVATFKVSSSLAEWATLKVDTLRLTTDKQLHNTDTTWANGALNTNGDNLFNYGWGTYNIANHNVIGNSIFAIKTLQGKWKKLMIEKLVRDTAFIFKYADLDGQNEKAYEFRKSDFSGKILGYFSFATDAKLDREPLAKDWDLVFHRYIGLTPNPSTGVLESYPLTGVSHNDGITVAKVRRDVNNNNTSGLVFQNKINIIGADWKSFTNNAWKIADSTAYFVKTASGKIYKIVFTGFGGSGNGNMIFTRESLLTSSVKTINSTTAAMSVYPNPVKDGNINIVYDLGKNVENFNIQLINMAGQVVYSQKEVYTEGLNQMRLPQLNLSQGMYIAKINWSNNTLTQKLYIQ
jgi:hypothetical protein